MTANGSGTITKALIEFPRHLPPKLPYPARRCSLRPTGAMLVIEKEKEPQGNEAQFVGFCSGMIVRVSCFSEAIHCAAFQKTVPDVANIPENRSMIGTQQSPVPEPTLYF